MTTQVTQDMIAAGAVGTAQMAAASVTSAQMAAGAVPQLESVTATVASNALTLTLNPIGSLDFRSSTLASGAVNSRTVPAAISLVVPSGATLGTANATQARLVMIALDNAGTVELAVVNLSGGLNLDETTLISTTAISASATAANVAYSTTARTNVPFRVVGSVDITETTAGTWATAPSAIQGAGGQALDSMGSIGYGQTWQNVSGSRAIGTTYYNTTGRPIQVSVGMTLPVAAAKLTINGVDLAFANSPVASNTLQMQLAGIVPPGGSYVVTATSGSPTIAFWAELR